MRWSVPAVLFALVLAAPASAAEGDIAVPVALASGQVLTLRAVTLVGEDLGRRLVLVADFDGPRPPSADPGQARVEAEEALELCRRHLPDLSRHLADPPRRRITHLEVLYRETKTYARVEYHERRGLRVDTRRHACPGA